ncbi:MarR family transcriptional regulator [Microbacterium sp. NPDC056234]|uniref:GbsR/MarR family transcriptional regulator n=1 Tax=Microbacterium sp. NPDC056234 TaxID=3345757 RepID=UPI0035DD62A2
MANGRLRIDDRRVIADGVAHGLSFAEIARRIGRPTSTVSREVARHGHRDYRADQAQQATGRRVRPYAAPQVESDGDRTSSFVAELASALAATGMPRMPARIFASLVTTTADSMAAADLVRALGVSPASVSKAIGYLEGMELVERDHDPGSRRERYRVGSDIWTRAVRADSDAHADVADASSRGIAFFGADSAPGIRLAQMGRFFGELTDQLRGSGLADQPAGDAVIIVTALGHAGRPVTAAELAGALGWSASRIDDALQDLDQRPAVADPFIVSSDDHGYRLRARPDRLSGAQRAALSAPRGDAGL